MLKKAVRLGILMVLVLFLTFGVTGVRNTYATDSSTIAPNYTFQVFILDWVWNGSLDTDSWPPAPITGMYSWPAGTTIGQVKADMSSKLGYPVVLFTATDGTCATNFPFYHLPGDSEIVDNYHCGDGFAFAVFRAQKASENVRLTLFGYVNDNNKSCVLWSLDGARPVNVDSKCGGGSELVCKVKLVGKKLNYDCDGGYDWLGEQIVNDPKWLAWAHDFASMNGNK